MLTQPPRIDVETDGAKPRKFVFVLLPEFTLLCFASALESLRIANRMAGKTLYEWELMGEGGTFITCSAGTEFRVDKDLEEVSRDDTV
ncbi:MAG: GlxA family transcriptional regulator, partial [Pseudomonadota bacterium]